MVDPNSVKSIFLAALEKPPAERDAYLEQAAGGDAALRAGSKHCSKPTTIRGAVDDRAGCLGHRGINHMRPSSKAKSQQLTAFNPSDTALPRR